MIDEAPLQDHGSGLRPESAGWFVVNVRDAQWVTTEDGEKRATGSECTFESAAYEFSDHGFRIHVLPPGQSNGLYHRENTQEDFLVLEGECTLVVEGEERALRQWDYFHSPPGTEHIFVGAGDGPCVLVMAGPRPAKREDWSVVYPVSEMAAQHGVSAAEETTDPDVAYADFEPGRRGRPTYWDRLPWSG